MKMIKIKFNFGEKNEAQLLVAGKTIVTAMTGNVHFTSLAASIAVLKQVFDVFEKALVKAKSRNKTAIAEKNAAMAALVDQLEVLGLFVCGVAMGNEAILATSGYELKNPRRKNAAIKELPVLTNIIINRGPAPGDAEVIVNQKIGDIALLSYDYTTSNPATTANPTWIKKATREKRQLFTGLPLERKIWFRIVGTGDHGQTTVSPIILFIAY